jgi:hypothetical protein
MKVHYWIQKLKAKTLLKILRINKPAEIASLTHIEVTWLASLMMKLLNLPGILSFPIHKIENRTRIAGPMLNLSGVRNNKGEVIAIDIYHHILAIRQKICDQLLESFKWHGFLKNRKSINMLAANLGILIAQEIQTTVYFAHYACWKNYQSHLKKENKNILIIPKSQWSDELKKELDSLVDEIGVDSREKSRLSVFLGFGKYMVKAFWMSRFPFFKSTKKREGIISKQSAPQAQEKPWKIMVNYSMGMDREKRNDITFFHDSSLPLSRLLVYFKFKATPISDNESQWMKDNGVSSTAAPGLNLGPGVIQWRPTELLKHELANVSSASLGMLKKIITKPEKHSLWLIMKLWKIHTMTAYWKDFFLGNHVKVLVNSVPSMDNFIPAMAISEIGGLAVSIERSILFDYCTYIHNAPNDIHFITGPYSLTQIPEPTFSIFTIQSGAINVVFHSEPVDGIENLKKHSKFTITVFDEMPNDVFFGAAISQMYEALIDMVDSDARFGLLIKTKKPQVFEILDKVHRRIIKLSGENKCLIGDWKLTPSAATAAADLVVTVPSTAAFESVITGTPTIVFNPMRSGSGIFYSNDGLDRRIFEDNERMIAAIKNYADGNDPTIGDCSDIAAQIDPFRDGLGPQRIGEYLNWCLQGFDSGLERQEVIQQANNHYKQQFGTDKVTIENFYEKKYKNH